MRAEVPAQSRVFCRPYGTIRIRSRAIPTVETVGYYLPSLRDYGTVRIRNRAIPPVETVGYCLPSLRDYD